MFFNQILIALRRFKRFKIPVGISFVGLFVALVTFILLAYYLSYHFTFDKVHHNKDRIVRLHTEIQLQDQQNIYAASAFHAGPALMNYFPSIQHLVRWRQMPATVTFEDQVFDEGLLALADTSFFEVFTFEFIEGNSKQFLHHPNSIVIREEMASKYFPDESALGKLLSVDIGNQTQVLSIVGVVADPPQNSSIHFDLLAPIQLISENFRPGFASLIPGLTTYFLIEENSLENIQAGLTSFVEENVPDNLQSVMSFQLSKLPELYFQSGYQFDYQPKGNKKSLWGLLILGFFTLILALINHSNISTALGIKRAKEIAVRKVLGSSPRQIRSYQFLESLVLISATCLLAAAVSRWWLQHQLAKWLEMDLAELTIHQSLFWGYLVLVIFMLTIASTFYPALVLSRLSVVKVFKHEMKVFTRRFDIKKLLLGIQFTVSIFFLIAAWIVYDQLHFAQTKDPGFSRDNVVLIDIAGPQNQDRVPAMRQTFESIPGVTNSSASTSSIYGVHTQATFSVIADSNEISILSDVNYIDESFLSTYRVQILSGRDFSMDIPQDNGRSIILNEAAVKRLGYQNIDDILGKEIEKIARDTQIATVIGVVADYHFASLYQPIAPMFLQIQPNGRKNTLAVRIQGSARVILPVLEEKWKETANGSTFSYQFLDEMMNVAYRSDRQLGNFVQVISLILLLISCMGIYGLTLFMVEQKLGEIGIRKTLGANLSQLLVQLHRPFFVVLTVAAMIAAITAYWVAQQWLDHFAYHIHSHWYHFLGAIVMVFGLAILSMGWITIRAALRSPVEVLHRDK